MTNVCIDQSKILMHNTKHTHPIIHKEKMMEIMDIEHGYTIYPMNEERKKLLRSNDFEYKKKYFLWIKIDVYVSMWLFFSNVIIQFFSIPRFISPFFTLYPTPDYLLTKPRNLRFMFVLFFLLIEWRTIDKWGHRQELYRTSLSIPINSNWHHHHHRHNRCNDIKYNQNKWKNSIQLNDWWATTIFILAVRFYIWFDLIQPRFDCYLFIHYKKNGYIIINK